MVNSAVQFFFSFDTNTTEPEPDPEPTPDPDPEPTPDPVDPDPVETTPEQKVVDVNKPVETNGGITMGVTCHADQNALFRKKSHKSFLIHK